MFGEHSTYVVILFIVQIATTTAAERKKGTGKGKDGLPTELCTIHGQKHFQFKRFGLIHVDQLMYELKTVKLYLIRTTWYTVRSAQTSE